MTSVSILDQLRGAGTPKPKADPELAGGLREWLEDSLAGGVARLGVRDRALRVNNEVLGRLGTSGTLPSSLGPRDATAEDLALLRLVRCLFRQWMTTGRIEAPIRDALSAQAASGDPGGAVALVSRMSGEERRAFTDAVSAHASRITATWPALSPAWYPRAHERFTVPLCGGRVMLSGIADLVVGPQATSEASVCIVEIQTGRCTSEDRSALHFLALLETLRAGAAPSRVATYYTGTGELHAEPVDEHLLVSALLRTISGVERLLEPFESRRDQSRRDAGRSCQMTTVQTSPMLHVTLPRAATLTDVLLSPPGPPVDADELTLVRENLVAELRGATRGLRGPRVLRIDAYRIHLALSRAVAGRRSRRALLTVSGFVPSCHRDRGRCAVPARPKLRAGTGCRATARTHG